MNDNFLPLYASQIQVFDEQIGQIIDYLKRTNQYDNTMIVLVGDHGVAMPPKWDFKKNTFAHYEEHVRVPLLIKPGVWSKNTAQEINSPVTAHKIIFDEIIRQNNSTIPDLYRELPQYDKEFANLAISETVYHPDNDNYALMIVSTEYKYWMIAKIDWNKFKIQLIIDEKLFQIDSDGIAIEDKNLVRENNFKEVSLEFRNKSLKFFERSCEFRKKFPISKFPSTINLK